MSDQQIGKKELEAIDLDHFLEAYTITTDEKLTVVAAGECPDFIAQREDGQFVGIELTKVTRSPSEIRWDKLLDNEDQMDTDTALTLIHYQIEQKESARASRYVSRVKSTILVVQLVDGALDSIVHALEFIKGDFDAHGFYEVWLADYTGLEAYGDIELFGLYPSEYWGYHQRLWPDRKPYG